MRPSGHAKAVIARDIRGLEYGDILPAGCNAPLNKKIYRDYVYKRRDGVYCRIPHNTKKGPEKLGILYGDSGTLVLYKPKLFVAKAAKSLKLAVLLPAHFKTVESLWLGGKKVQINGIEDKVLAESINPVDVIFKDGPVWVGMRPAGLTDHGRKAAVRIEMLDRNLLVSFYNYEGPARNFTPTELDTTLNGFALEVRTVDEIEGMQELRDVLASASLEDTIKDGNRRAVYKRAGLSLECDYNLPTQRIQKITINGKPFEEPRFRATGLPRDFQPTAAREKAK